ncbi:hypothetical protein [Coraliomargarita sinensis]|uniref:hypothetical protein n=1 Tax=Coraliomargarita sinensis TaxID=2174842 RepID=UPI0011B5EC52|nr:hypothetical protein [Coraliomargarita sinensis]
MSALSIPPPPSIFSPPLNKWRPPSIRETVQHLVKINHGRTVFLVRKERCKPKMETVERVFLEELEGHGIKSGAHHLPHGEERPKAKDDKGQVRTGCDG